MLLIKEKEVFGFNLFSIATEPYFGCALVVFIPIILETMCSNSGFELDHITTCNTKVENYNCELNFLGYWVNTTSFILYLTSLSVLLQAIVFVMVSCMADYGKLRYKMLHLFGFIGALFSILFVIKLDFKYYWLYSIFTLISNVAFGASYVFYYAYLPLLTSNHPKVIELIKDDIQEVDAVREKVGNEISGTAFAYGFFSAVLVLVLSALFIFVREENIYNLQICTAFIGIWFIIFSFGSLKYLEDKEGKALPKGENYIWFSLKENYKLMKNIIQLNQLGVYLLSWFFLSDSLHSIVHIAIMFSKIVLKMSSFELLLISIITPLFAGIGNLVFNFIQKRLAFTTKKMIILINIFYIAFVFYCLLSILPLSFGLKNKFEIYIIASIHGLLLGPIHSFCRVQFSEILPTGKENQFFGLYEITDKGSSWLGPLIIGFITHYFGNLKFGLFYILFSFVLSLILLFFFHPDVAKKQSRKFLIN